METDNRLLHLTVTCLCRSMNQTHPPLPPGLHCPSLGACVLSMPPLAQRADPINSCHEVATSPWEGGILTFLQHCICPAGVRNLSTVSSHAALSYVVEQASGETSPAHGCCWRQLDTGGCNHAVQNQAQGSACATVGNFLGIDSGP
jgi:hypothetical protein